MKHAMKITAGIAGMIAAVAGFSAYAHQEGRAAQSTPCMHDGGQAGADHKGQGMQHGGGMAQMQERMGRNHGRMAEMHSRMHGATDAPEKKEDLHKH